MSIPIISERETENHDNWIYLCCSGHAPETPGLWIHSTDNSEVTWFPPKMSCNCGGKEACFNGGDALMLAVYTISFYNAAWCDEPKSYQANFICESMIWWKEVYLSDNKCISSKLMLLLLHQTENQIYTMSRMLKEPSSPKCEICSITGGNSEKCIASRRTSK